MAPTASSATSNSSWALTNAVSDAGCCAWDDKRAFDSVRPITAISFLFQGQPVRAWAGPYRGTQLIDGASWFPYQPTTFPTPPFPEYSSGHSNFSAAGAEILKLFTHSDRFRGSVTLAAGSSRAEPGAVPATDVTLSWPTFSYAADEAGHLTQSACSWRRREARRPRTGPGISPGAGRRTSRRSRSTCASTARATPKAASSA